MRILFEEHQYKPEALGAIVQDVTGVEQDIVDKSIRLGYVGYFFSPAVQDCVFILPKVLLEDEKGSDGKTREILAHVKHKDTGMPITPEDIITPEGQKDCLTQEYKKFIYEFSVWIYRSINMYRKLNPEAKAVYTRQLPTEGRGKRHEARTILDVILSLINFNRENQDFFMFTIKNMHSGLNKINWTKTISHSRAYMQNGDPVYLDAVNKRRMINFDEELFIIFFSILNYLNVQYGFKVPLNCQYELITGGRFENLRKGQGMKRLRAIKYKYFSDKALELWDLCFAFFDCSHKICVNVDQRDFLLAKSFETVFEAMIDELIGAPRKDIPRGLKDQADGKRVDHMYAYDALLRSDGDKTDEQIYYIGDSKYYKNGHNLNRDSVYKQYTYARNVIQWNIDLFMNGARKNWSAEDEENLRSDRERFKGIRLRKDAEDGTNVTEGYNVIPNFFLSAYVDNLEYNDREHSNIRLHTKGATIEEHSTYITYQFPNRLFDRDTLILSHYDVNFLYVIYLYARNNMGEKAAWKKEVREIFREEIRTVLGKKFNFYALTPLAPGQDEAYLERNFQKLLGKIYTPYEDKAYYSLALEKEDGKGSELIEELKHYFFVTPTKLGNDPDEDLKKSYGEDYRQKSAFASQLAQVDDEELILVGCVKSEEHWEWIKSGHYNIRIQGGSLTPRPGEMKYTRSLMMVSRLLLYMYNEKEHVLPKYLGLFNLSDPEAVPGEYKGSMLSEIDQNVEYPSPDPDQKYLVYDIDVDGEAKSPSNESLNAWLASIVDSQPIGDKGVPVLITSRELKGIIKPDEVDPEEQRENELLQVNANAILEMMKK